MSSELLARDDAPHVLVVEDEEPIRRLLATTLAAARYQVFEAATAREGETLAGNRRIDVFLIDLGLPDRDGHELIRSLRRWTQRPIIVLSARTHEAEKVQALDAGADDYLSKPFHTPELLARLRALIRRAQGLASPRLRCGPLELDTRSGEVTVAGRPVSLTAHEYRLLAYLMHRPGQLVSRGELTEHLYAQDFDRDSNTIEVFVARLRRKLPAELIETVRGRGYRLQARA